MQGPSAGIQIVVYTVANVARHKLRHTTYSGTPCQITGDGFHASNPCRHKCLSRWSLACPDQTRVTPNVCTGAFACTPGSCPAGQVCYHDDDPFDDRTFCVPDNVCGDLSQPELTEWELSTLARQKDIIEQREAQ